MFLLAMAMLLLLPSQARAQGSPQQSVDLTTRMARTTHDGLRKIKNQPSKKIDFVAAPTTVETVQTTAADKKRDAVVKTKAQAAASASKVKDKRETAIKKMAHHPAARPGLKSGNAPRRDGEVLDDYGVIIKPAQGQRKVYNRSGMALMYDPDGDSWLLTEQSGSVDVVFCDNGDVYIKDLISTYRNSAWVKGSLDGNTITIPTGQLVSYESYYGVPYAIYWGVRDGRDYFRDDTREAITLTIDGDQITLDGTDEENIIGVFYEYDGNAFFSNSGDYESVYTFDHDFVPMDVVTVTPPAGLQTEVWYTRGHYYEGSSVPFRGQVNLGFDGDDVYLQGLFAGYPDAWRDQRRYRDLQRPAGAG